MFFSFSSSRGFRVSEDEFRFGHIFPPPDEQASGSTRRAITTFRSRAAEFLGGEWHDHRIAALIQTLENCGVLLTGVSGLRLTPALFSDDVGYRACYDHRVSWRRLKCFGCSSSPVRFISDLTCYSVGAKSLSCVRACHPLPKQRSEF